MPQRFDKYYKKGDLLGSGGFAQVYKCTRRSDGKVFAVKILKDNAKVTSDSRFHAELEINQKLNHPHIINMHETFEKPKFSLVLDFCQGGDLCDDIEKKSNYSEKDAAKFMRQILTGLDYIHSQQVIHLDLKPENILLTPAPESMVKIADFGIAMDVSKTDGRGRGIFGTNEYLAPEMFQYRRFTYSADLWSVGVIFFILLSGMFPFNNTDESCKKKVEFRDPVFKSTSKAVQELIARFLVSNPAERISCQAALQDLWFENMSDDHLVTVQAKIGRFNAQRKFRSGIAAVQAVNKMAKMTSSPRESKTAAPVKKRNWFQEKLRCFGVGSKK